MSQKNRDNTKVKWKEEKERAIKKPNRKREKEN
jgi:hypothetical protein